ncbi:MAG: metallophosphatase family protein [Bacteroidales bacterium]|nr:metallophosphatase family protein [Bacteroidales bacterium]
MKKIGILSDSHGYTNPDLFEFFKDCSEIWHAGDMCNDEILYELETIAPVKAVYGNCDGWDIRDHVPKYQIFDCEQHKVLMAHIVGKPGHYEPDILQLIQTEKPTLLVAGHSHILRVIRDPKYNLLYINPGAAGKYGFHQLMTFVRFDVDGNEISNFEIHQEEK